MITVQDSFFSADVTALREGLGGEYGRIRFTDGHLTIHEHLLATPQLCVNRLLLSGSLAIEAEVAMFTSVLSTGEYRWSVDDDRGEAQKTPFLLRPGTTATASMSDGEVVALTIDPASLEATARLFYADDRLTVRFASAGPVTAVAGRIYRNLLVSASAYLPLLPDSELLQRSLYRMMAAGLLECFPLHGDPAPRRASVRSRLDGYRRARTYIDDHASEPITVDDVAAAAALSVPQLDAALRAHSPAGLGAAGELRRARLAGAHADLLSADAGRGDTVRAIALRWGFSPSGFAREYRTVYNVTPRHTLTR